MRLKSFQVFSKKSISESLLVLMIGMSFFIIYKSVSFNAEKKYDQNHKVKTSYYFLDEKTDSTTALIKDTNDTLDNKKKEPQLKSADKEDKEDKDKSPFYSIICRAADKHHVEPELIKAIIMAESGYNTRAVSKKGAKGLMQLMPTTAKSLGVVDLFNPEHNINGGVKYFRYLLDKFNGDTKLALAAYNAGSRKVMNYNGIPPYKATHYYIARVYKYYNYYKKQTSCSCGKFISSATF